MDLSFSRFEADATVVALPPDLAVLMVGIAARQAASPTALVQGGLPTVTVQRAWFAPAPSHSGTFHPCPWWFLHDI